MGGKAFNLPHQINAMLIVHIFHEPRAVTHKLRLCSHHHPASGKTSFLSLPFLYLPQESRHFIIVSYGGIQIVMPENQRIQIKNKNGIDILPDTDKRGVLTS